MKPAAMPEIAPSPEPQRPPRILIEGYAPDEILELTDAQMEAFVFTGRSVVLQVGTAQILGQFRREPTRIIIELAHIDGGGEGVLPLLWRLAERYARLRDVGEVEWIVHAVACARPNPKLRRVLERRGFVVEDVSGIGRAFHRVQTVPCNKTRRRVSEGLEGTRP